MGLRWLTTTMFAAFLALGSPAVAGPLTIEYLATDLADVDAGQDLWQYLYFLRDFDFQANQGFSVYFEPGLYDTLQSSPPAPNGDWDPLTYQPDSVVFSPGVYDALALTDQASLANPFAVTFVWLGGAGTLPASQVFDVYNYDSASGNISVVETGNTVQQVPEPSSLLLVVAAGVVGLADRLRRRSRS